MATRKNFDLEELVAHVGYKIVRYEKDWEYWNNVYVPVLRAPDGFEFPFALVIFKFNSAVLVRDFALTPKVLKRVEWYYRSDLTPSEIAIVRHPKTNKVVNIIGKSFLYYKSKNNKNKK